MEKRKGLLSPSPCWEIVTHYCIRKRNYICLIIWNAIYFLFIYYNFYGIIILIARYWPISEKMIYMSEITGQFIYTIFYYTV